MKSFLCRLRRISQSESIEPAMENSDLIAILIGLAAGCLLGLVYFGGLWWTTRQLSSTPHPGPFVMASFVTRLGVLAAGLFATAQLGVASLGMAVVGLLFVRQLMIRHVQVRPARTS